MRKSLPGFYILLILLLAFTSTGSAQNSVTLVAAMDNTIYDDSTEYSNGAGHYVFTGTSANAGNKRALVWFDMAAALPAEAILDSVVLSLTATKGLLISPKPVSVHRLNKTWGEGDSKAPSGEGKGAPAATGDATWTYNTYNTDSWQTAGGDFESTASASLDVTMIGKYEWRGAGLLADVNGWLENESSNNGWILIGQEDSLLSSKQWGSRQNPTEGNRPILTLYYQQATSVQAPNPGAGPDLLRAWPNPFEAEINITIQFDEDETVQLGVYNLLGQQIQVITNGQRSPGIHQFTWNGSDRSGKPVPRGMYYVIFVKGDERQVLKIMKSR